MTLSEFILQRSYLPKDGTYTMLEHTMAMLMYVEGLESKLEITNSETIMEVVDGLDVITVADDSDSISIGCDDDNVIINDIIEVIEIKD